MSIFDKLKLKKKPDHKPELKAEAKIAAKPEEKKPAKPAAVKSTKPEDKAKPKAETKPADLKGKTAQAYRIIIKPLITEKATYLNAINKYAFSIDPKMNKVEVKKAIRTIYKVNPVAVNIANFYGKNVRSGRSQGQTKSWKKAIVTLKPGDKIEVYEGV